VALQYESRVWWVAHWSNQKLMPLIRLRHISFQRSPTMAGSGGAGSQPNMLEAQPMLSIIIAPPM